MSPIFVRPVREQLEHDRLIRFLQARYKRKLDALINVGDERVNPLKIGTATFFPDLVLTDGKKVAGVVEVETGESVNNLEAMAQWVHFSKARVPFHLYVPVSGYDAARRLCEAQGAKPAEIWTYRPTNDGFDLVRMLHDPNASAQPGAKTPAAKPQTKTAASKTPAAAKTSATAKAKPAKSKPAAKAKPSGKSAKKTAAKSRKSRK